MSVGFARGFRYAGTAGEWREACGRAELAAIDSPETARAFFESEFVPYRVGPGVGLFTGYYEPQLRGSRTRHGPYQTPLYGVPIDLVSVDLGLFRENLRGQRLVGKVVDGMDTIDRIAADVTGVAVLKHLGTEDRLAKRSPWALPFIRHGIKIGLGIDAPAKLKLHQQGLDKEIGEIKKMLA